MSDFKVLTHTVSNMLLITILVLLTISGNPTVLFYAVVVFGIYPIVISMIVQNWDEKGIIIRESESITLQRRFYGMTLSEEVAALKNIYFSNIEQLKSKLVKIAISKLTLIILNILISLIFLANTLATANNLRLFLVRLGIGLILLSFVVYKSKKHIKLFFIIKNKSWIVKSYTDNNREYFSAYILHKIKEHELYTPVFTACLN